MRISMYMSPRARTCLTDLVHRHVYRHVCTCVCVDLCTDMRHLCLLQDELRQAEAEHERLDAATQAAADSRQYLKVRLCVCSCMCACVRFASHYVAGP